LQNQQFLPVDYNENTGIAQMPLASTKISLNEDDSSAPSLLQQHDNHVDLDLPGANFITIQIGYDECKQKQAEADANAGPDAEQIQSHDELDHAAVENTRRDGAFCQDQRPQNSRDHFPPEEHNYSNSDTEEPEGMAAASKLRGRRRITRIKGSFAERLQLAVRVSLAVLSYFSVMVYTRQQVFNAIWLGNTFVVLTSMKENFGESLLYTMVREPCRLCDGEIEILQLTSFLMFHF
jgi:hypothetical protein